MGRQEGAGSLTGLFALMVIEDRVFCSMSQSPEELESSWVVLSRDLFGLAWSDHAISWSLLMPWDHGLPVTCCDADANLWLPEVTVLPPVRL